MLFQNFQNTKDALSEIWKNERISLRDLKPDTSNNLVVEIATRLRVEKIACFNVKMSLSEMLTLIQFDFGIKGSSESLVQSVRSFFKL